MSIYCWGYEIKTLPSPPTGINQGSPWPPAEVVSTVPTRVVDMSDPNWSTWLTQIGTLLLIEHKMDEWQAINAAISSGNLNLDMDVWKGFVKNPPPHKTVQLQAIAQWKQIYSTYNMGNSSKYQQGVTEGVTTTDEQSKSFGEKVGVSVSAGWGPVSATLSTEFSAQQSESHSVSFTNQTTQNEEFDIPASCFIQIWQLSMQTKADDGSYVEQATLNFQALTYPARAKQMSREEAEARAKALVARSMTKR